MSAARSPDARGMAGATRAVPLTPPIVAPSILSADFSRLAEALALPDPARDWVHCDVMDNHFVPNLTFGPLIIAAARKLTPAFLDVHLMIEEPQRLVVPFRNAGADQLTVHLEACADPGATLAAVKASGARAGLALKPGTSLELAETFLGAIDLLLIMTVEPGFGGQAFMPDMMTKVAAAKAWREKWGAKYLIEVDGGIGEATARPARAAGAEVFVAGHSIYGSANPVMSLATIRAAVA